MEEARGAGCHDLWMSFLDVFQKVFHTLSLSHCLSANNSYCSGSGTGREPPDQLLLEEERCPISDAEAETTRVKVPREDKWQSHSQKNPLVERKIQLLECLSVGEPPECG